MAFGFQANTPTGEVVIADDEPTMVVLETHTVGTDDWEDGGETDLSTVFFYRVARIQFTGQYDANVFVGIRQTSGGEIVRPIIEYDNQRRAVACWLLQFSGSPTYDVIILGSSQVYDGTISTHGETHGMQVRGPDQSIWYDSRWRNVPTFIGHYDVQDLNNPTETNGEPDAGQIVTLPFATNDAFFVLDALVGQNVYTFGTGLDVVTRLLYPAIEVLTTTSFEYKLHKVRHAAVGVTTSNYSGRILVLRYENF